MKNEYSVLFVAMSGVRVKDKELLSLGMTLPGFVDRSEVIASLPSLSLLTLASYCPDNWHVDYIEIDDLNEEINNVTDYDLVAISTFTARAYDAYEVSKKIRDLGVTVVMGGLHVSALPHEAIRNSDTIVVGQAEVSWPFLLRDFEKKNLKKVYDQNDYKRYQLNQCRLPRYDLINIDNYSRLTLQTSRGCPHHCSFCAASRTISPYQLKPIEKIEEEIQSIFDIWSNPFIELADDNTFVNKRWSKELVELFKKYPMKWFTETDISIADDKELLELLAESNCDQIIIGCESAVPESLVGIDAHDWKKRQFENYIEKIGLIQKYGISVNGCFILGLDSDDEKTFDLTDEFIKDSELSEVQITLLTPFPGTELYRNLKNERRLLKDEFWDECTLFDVTHEPANMSAETLRQGFHYLMESVYSEERVQKRKRKFKEIRRSRRNKLKEVGIC